MKILFILSFLLSLTGCMISPAGVDTVHRATSGAEYETPEHPLSVPVTLESLTTESYSKAFEPKVIADKTRMSIVEFDDQGELKEPDQLIETTRWLRSRGHEPILVMLFVHGWNHNAGAHDQNLAEFRNTLKDLRTTGIYPNGEILGVYLSWPGNVLNEPMPGDLALQFWSFGNRYRAAQRVGRLSCTEAMLSVLASARLEGNGSEMKARERKDVQTVVVGHSMGGLVVERGFIQAMLGYNIINAPTNDLVEQLQASTKTEKARHEAEGVRLKGAGETINLNLAKVQEEIDAEEPNRADIEKWEAAMKRQIKAHAAMLAASAPLLVQLRDLNKNIGEVAQVFDQFDLANDKPAKIEAMRIAWYLKDPAAGLLPELEGLVAKLEALRGEVSSEEEWAKEFELLVESLGTGEVGENKSVFWKTAPIESVEKLVADSEFKDLDQNTTGTIYAQREALKATLKLVPVWVKSVEGFRGSLSDREKARTVIAKLDTIKLAESKQKLVAAESKLKDEKKLKNENDQAITRCIIAAKNAAELVGKLSPMREQTAADLVLLVNPASEAIIAREVNDLGNPGRAGELNLSKHNKVPWIISVSSDMDTTTGWVFRAGMRAFGTADGAARRGSDQLRYMESTAPHIPEMRTHRVLFNRVKNDYELEKIKEPKSRLWIVHAAEEDLGKTVITNHGDFWNAQFRRVVLLMMETVNKLRIEEDTSTVEKPMPQVTSPLITNE